MLTQSITIGSGKTACMTVMIAGMIAVCMPPAIAAPRQLRIDSDSNLRFGSFAVIDQGYRVLTPNGGVQNSGLFSITSGDTAPARFTISYDRGNNSQKRLDLRIQLVFSNAPTALRNGVVARLSAYQTDLPGAATVQPGRIVEVEISNCIRRVCSTSFAMGARLDIERNYGGGSIEIPILVDAVLISVK